MVFKRLSRRLFAPVTAMLSIFFSSFAHAEYVLNMTKGVSTISNDIYDLHMLVMWICFVVGIIVFSVMAYSIMTHRKSKGAVASNFHESTTVEIIWTLVPLAILIAIAVPATATLLDLEDSSKSDVSIQVTGIQWKWRYKYLGEDVEFISSLSEENRDAVSASSPNSVEHYLRDVDKRIVVPVNKKIEFLFTSDDVIHAWWVPELAVKQDTVPGFINTSWAYIEKPGIYRGQCAELCGKDHGFMPIVVEAVTMPEYQKWLVAMRGEQAALAASSDKEWTQAELMAKGESVYKATCAACHGATGAGIPPVFPAMTNSPVATGDVKGHINIVMNGKTGTAMQAFKTQLSDVDLAAVITFERNSFGNTVGDLVQPSTIKSLR